MTPAKAAVARRLYDSREHTVAGSAQTLGVSRASVYRHLPAAGSPADPPVPPAAETAPRPGRQGPGRRRR
jgi:hypothetical protein